MSIYIRLALAAAAIWVIAIFAAQPAVALPVRALVVGVAALSFLRPIEGLLVVTLLAPLGDLVRVGFELGPIRLTETIVVAFLAGWLLRGPWNRKAALAPPSAITYGAWTLIALVCASVVVQALRLQTTQPAEWRLTANTLPQMYFYQIGDSVGAIGGARLVEGFGLAAAVIVLLRAQPMLAVWVPEALAAGCAVAAVTALLLWRGIALPAILQRHLLIGYRVSALVADVNAAGSYFALLLCVAAGMAARESGRKRLAWTAAAASALFGLFMSASRSATMAAALSVAVAATWVATRRWPRSFRYGLIAAALVVIAVIGLARERQIEHQDVYRGAGFRTQFAETSYRMIHAHPWFGIGIGQYYPISPLFLSPELAWAYGSENAHNWFLQLAAEIGLIGFAACAVLLVGAVILVGQGLARAPDDYRLLGLAAGVGAFLITCLTGHPLLVLEVADPFWIAAGLLAALALHARQTATVKDGPQMWRGRVAAVAALALLAVSIPIRAREAPPNAPRAREVDGLSRWEAGGGRRYRSSGEYASVFVDGSASRVEIPMRSAREAWEREPLSVEVSVDGRRLQRVDLHDAWTPVNIILPPAVPVPKYRRINIRIERTSTAAFNPASSGNDRELAAHIGEPRVLEPPTPRT